MRPISLTLENINSYRERQTIDFENLSRYGIFGIFGNTGSGKSTIISAIIFVLYNQVETSVGNGTIQDLINLRSDNAFIGFEFEARREIYRVEANIYRKKQNQYRKYKKIDGHFRALENESIEDIIGLSYGNFCKVVVIPQGKFQEFFALTKAKRAEMLQSIFPNLNRYDLSKRISELKNQTFERTTNIQGQLNQLQEYSPENLQQLKKELEETDLALTVLEKDRNSLKQEVDTDRRILQLYREREIVKKEKELLDISKPDIEREEKNLARYNNAMQVFHSPLKELKYFEDNLKKNIALNRETENRLETATERLSVCRETFSKVESDYRNMEEKQREKQTIEDSIAVRELQKRITDKDEEIRHLSERINNGRKETEKVRDEKNNLEKEITELKLKKTDSELVSNLREWHNENEKIRTKKENEIKNIKNLEAEADVYRRQITKETGFCGKSYEETKEFLESEIKLKEEDRKLLENGMERYKIAKAFENTALTLKEGEPCPFCGSLHHPKIMTEHATDDILRDYQQKIIAMNAVIDDLKRKLSLSAVWFEEINRINIKLRDAGKALSLLREQKESHRQGFVWEEYRDRDAEDIKRLEQVNNALDKEMERKQKRLNEMIRLADKYGTALQGLQENVNLLYNHKAAMEGEKKRYERNGEKLLTSLSVGELRSEANRIETEIGNIKSGYEKCKKELDETEKEVVRLRTDKKNHEANIKDFGCKVDETNRLLEENILKSSYFQSLEEVREILELNPDVEQVSIRINEFRSRYSEVNAKYKILSERLDDCVMVDAEALQGKEKALKQMDDECGEMTKRKGSLLNMIQTTEVKLKEKREKRDELDRLNRRASGLSSLETMFSGKRFVQFVASVYMDQLCSKTNERLRIITRNNFEIAYSDNDFVVMDYLNEGRKRPVSTLSGGQLFQISLCMALALVDTIHVSGNNNQNFFFIDEGFGTQDSDSLDLIFQSLKALRGQDKTVGLISHNEAMKEKIPAYISTCLDPVRGSIVS